MEWSPCFPNVDVVTVHTWDLVDHSFVTVLMGSLYIGERISCCLCFLEYSLHSFLVTYSLDLLRRNANAVHHMNTGHTIDWNNAKILRREERWKERKILESIHIKSNSTFNLDSGFPLDQIWTDLISPSH